MRSERQNGKDRDQRRPPETQRQGQMETRETSGWTDRVLGTELHRDRGKYRGRDGERNTDHRKTDVCVKDRETQKGRVRESKERQRDQRDRHEYTASGGPILSGGSGSLPPPPANARSHPAPSPASWLPRGATSPDSSSGWGLPSPHWLGPRIPRASNSPSTRMVV